MYLELDHSSLPISLKYTWQDSEKAFIEWGANCGPHAIAAITGLTLDEVREHIGDYETKFYTNPKLMYSSLDSIGVKWTKIKDKSWPNWGLVRIQFEGPWTDPEAHWSARQRHTHWVGSFRDKKNRLWVFDFNTFDCVDGWISFEEWSESLIPWLIEQCEPESYVSWYITHSIEIIPRTII